jgi:hypothetical protein
MKVLFQCTQAHCFEQANLPQLNGLTLLSVDGVVYRTLNMKQIMKHSLSTQNTQYPQVRMVCQMELSSHLITASAFDDYTVNEMILAEKLIDTTPDNSLTLFDKASIRLDYCTNGNQQVQSVTGLFHLKRMCSMKKFEN